METYQKNSGLLLAGITVIVSYWQALCSSIEQFDLGTEYA